jgi:hypothetical protein
VVSILGTATIVDGKASRKLNNALTQTFEAGPDSPVAVATQKGSAGVLFGFKNGGSGTYLLTGGDAELTVECHSGTTKVSNEAGDVGTIETDKEFAVLRDATGAEVARLVGHPESDRANSAWTYRVLDGAGASLGDVMLIRNAGPISITGEIVDAAIWWGRAGKALKMPTLSTRLMLKAPVDGLVGDLLLAECVNLCLGPGGFFTPGR